MTPIKTPGKDDDFYIPNNQYEIVNRAKLTQPSQPKQPGNKPNRPKDLTEDQKYRINYMIESVVAQLEDQNDIIVPENVQITQQIDEVTNVVKFNFVY